MHDYLKRIDEAGGTLRAIETGYIQNEIQNAAYDYQRSVESRRARSSWASTVSSRRRSGGDATFRLDPALERAQIESLRAGARRAQRYSAWRRSWPRWNARRAAATT